MMVFEERGNPGYPGEKPRDAEDQETAANSTHIFRRRRYLNQKNCVECWETKRSQKVKNQLCREERISVNYVTNEASSF